jgi:hypothetical protein
VGIVLVCVVISFTIAAQVTGKGPLAALSEHLAGGLVDLTFGSVLSFHHAVVSFTMADQATVKQLASA